MDVAAVVVEDGTLIGRGQVAGGLPLEVEQMEIWSLVLLGTAVNVDQQLRVLQSTGALGHVRQVFDLVGIEEGPRQSRRSPCAPQRRPGNQCAPWRRPFRVAVVRMDQSPRRSPR